MISASAHPRSTMDRMWFLRSLCKKDDFDIDKAVMTVGRYRSHDLCCVNYAVSRRHAILTVEDGKLYVEALQSVNGTWVNGCRLNANKVQLSAGDYLSFGYSEHPDCGEEDNHYCYTVMLHNPPIHSSVDLLSILEGNEAITIKEEPMDPPNAKYSNNEEVIIIEDDDNFEFASSQIFREKSFIKTELEECIEISDDDDEDNDILTMIGLLSPADDGFEDERTNGDVPPNDNENLKQDEIANVALKEYKKIDNKDINDNKQDLIINNCVRAEYCPKKSSKEEAQDRKIELKSKSVVDRSFILRSKYSKPVVILPHIEDTSIKKRRKSITKEEKNNSKKQKTENKSLKEENKVKLNNKVNEVKLKNPRGCPRKQVENIGTDPPAKGRKSTHKKDNSTKSKRETSKSVKTIQNNVAVPNGNDSTSNARSYLTRSAVTKINGFKRDFTKGLNVLNNGKEITPTTGMENFTIPKKLTRHNLENIVPTSSKVDPRLKDSVCNAANNINDNDLEGILRCHVNYNVHPKPVNLRNEYPFLTKPSCGVIFSILGWNTKWLQEQQEQPVPPPIIRNDVVRMCTRFKTYEDYCNVVKPFIMLELWDNLSHGFELTSCGKKGFRTSISQVHKFTRYQILKCIAYTDDKDKKVLNRPKEGDVIAINIGVRPNPSARQAALKCLFAFVVNCRSHRLKSTDYIYRDLLSDNSKITTQLDIHLLLKPFPEEVLITKFVDATIISSVTSILRECDAVMHMTKSPISKLILNPKIEDFRVKLNSALVINKKNLCLKQIEAIHEACSLCVGNRPGLYLIQGPPGTGKTTVIQHIIQNLVVAKDNIRILVVAPSNATVDGIVRRLGNVNRHGRHKNGEDREKYSRNMVRFGIYDSVSGDLKKYFLDEIAKKKIIEQILQNRPEVRMDYENLRKMRYNLCMKLEEEKRSANKNVVHELSRNLKAVEEQINNFASHYYMGNHYWEMLQQTKRDVIAKAKIICTTLNSCIRLEEYDTKLDCCIVDEASQSKETETLIPLGLGIQKMILVGDPQQLPAVTLSKFAKDLEYGQSLFSRMKKTFISEAKEPITLLDTQFRMHPEICSYPNKTFYRGALKTAESCKSLGGLDKLVPYYLLNLKVENKEANGYSNRNEIDCVVRLLEVIHKTIRCKPNKYYTVGVITPYNSQKRDLLVQIDKLRLPTMQIAVNTVDSFQGSEKDIIILSCVRARANSFLDDVQRLNVALTRARRVLYVVGTNPLFDTCPTLNSLKSDAKARDLYSNVSSVKGAVLESLVVRKS